MPIKRKMSLTIDNEIYCAIEKAAISRNMAKSRLAQEAFELWLKKDIEAQMAKGYEDMAREDAEFANTALDAQREIL
ncbi:MAG: hypothetical protein JRJ04_17070 [Deltaproteobacteria bacterium]|nr:hypothetical protein [Deltaproteobacteria bacterium]